MSLIVQKFGGSSVADAEKIRNVCNIIADTKAQGHRVVVVLSAQGDTTDDLITKMDEITERASLREKDMLLSAGEQISVSLAAMCMESMGYPAVSLTGWQAGIRTTSQHTDAAIRTIDHSLIDHYLSMDIVPMQRSTTSIPSAPLIFWTVMVVITAIPSPLTSILRLICVRCLLPEAILKTASG